MQPFFVSRRRAIFAAVFNYYKLLKVKKMKEFLFLLLLIPFGVAAQKTKKWEAGLNTAINFVSKDKLYGIDYPLVTCNGLVSAYRNFNRLQVGVVVEGGWLGGGNDWWSPQGVVNYKIPFRKSYAYAGGVAGYVREYYFAPYDHSANGFVTGLQAGAVYFPGKRFGINLETGVRFQHMYRSVVITDLNSPEGYISSKVMGLTDIHFPLSVGVRYRF